MTDLERALHEQEQAKALILAKDQPTHAPNQNGYVQPLHDWLQWYVDNALEAHLAHVEYEMERAKRGAA